MPLPLPRAPALLPLLRRPFGGRCRAAPLPERVRSLAFGCLGLDGLRAGSGPDVDLPRRYHGLGHVLHPYPQQTAVGLRLHLLGGDPVGELEGAPERAVAHLPDQYLALRVLAGVAALA